MQIAVIWCERSNREDIIHTLQINLICIVEPSRELLESLLQRLFQRRSPIMLNRLVRDANVVQFGYFPSCINSRILFILPKGVRFTLNVAGLRAPLPFTSFAGCCFAAFVFRFFAFLLFMRT